MEKRITKKLFAGALALTAGCLLAGCDPVSAVPTDYNEPIVSLASNAKFDENILGTLYDSIATDMNSKVVDNLLKEVVKTQFGTYSDYKDDSYVEKGAFFKGASEHKISEFKKDVDNRLSEFFYNEITSGSYVDEEGQFSEKKMYNAHRQELYDLEEPSDEVVNNKFYVTKNFNKEDAFSSLKGDYTDYIEKKAFPEILKNKLVEDYIYRTNPLALGRSNARKIRYVKVSYDSESHTKTRNMLKYYAKEYVNKGLTIDFEDLADAAKGFSTFDAASGVGKLGHAADDLLNATYGKDFVTVPEGGYKYNTQVLIPAGNYYKHTKIGEIIEDFQKAEKAVEAGRFPTADDKAALDKFTSEGKTKEYGLLQKLISLAKEDYTTDGWFVKDGGASDLPSALRTRLFNIKTANELAKSEPETEIGKYDKKAYIRNIAGTNFVLPSEADKVENDPINYMYDDNSSTIWICVVEEAVSPSNFITTNKAYLGNDKDHPYRLEDISRQVAKVLGSKQNYIKEAYTEYLNQYKDVIFYDSSLYEYLKAEYPDLDIFDED